MRSVLAFAAGVVVGVVAAVVVGEILAVRFDDDRNRWESTINNRTEWISLGYAIPRCS